MDLKNSQRHDIPGFYIEALITLHMMKKKEKENYEVTLSSRIRRKALICTKTNRIFTYV